MQEDGALAREGRLMAAAHRFCRANACRPSGSQAGAGSVRGAVAAAA
jgi:hypothetical protein